MLHAIVPQLRFAFCEIHLAVTFFNRQLGNVHVLKIMRDQATTNGKVRMEGIKMKTTMVIGDLWM